MVRDSIWDLVTTRALWRNNYVSICHSRADGNPSYPHSSPPVIPVQTGTHLIPTLYRQSFPCRREPILSPLFTASHSRLLFRSFPGRREPILSLSSPPVIPAFSSGHSREGGYPSYPHFSPPSIPAFYSGHSREGGNPSYPHFSPPVITVFSSGHSRLIPTLHRQSFPPPSSWE